MVQLMYISHCVHLSLITEKCPFIQNNLRYQKTLPDLISSRGEPHLTHEEVAKVMKWKLTVIEILILMKKVCVPTSQLCYH